MIILKDTDKIQVKLDSAITVKQLECYASFRDTTSSTITPGATGATTNGVTAKDLVSSPSANTQRVIDYLSVYNGEVIAENVSVLLTVGSTAYELAKFTLQPGEKLEYQEGSGFRSLGNGGEIKQGFEVGDISVSGFNYVVLGATVINNQAVANTMIDIPGLSFSVSASKTYWFRFTMPYGVTAATTGSRFAINGPTATAMWYESSLSTQTGAFGVNCGLSTYDSPAASNLSSTAGANIAIVEGVITLAASGNGNIIGRFASETAGGTVSVFPGAVVYYRQLN